MCRMIDWIFLTLQSEERGTPSRRSKSEGPYRIPNGQAYPIGDEVDKASRAPDTGRKVDIGDQAARIFYLITIYVNGAIFQIFN